MAMRIVPSASHPSSTTNLTTHNPTVAASKAPGAPSAPGIHDTLRHNIQGSSSATTSINGASTPVSTHPLEARLVQWRATQNNLKMQGLRRQFGIAEPVKRSMELKLTRAGEWRPGALGGSAGLSGDILEGRDDSIDWEDVFQGDDTKEQADMHTEMETKLKMNW